MTDMKAIYDEFIEYGSYDFGDDTRTANQFVDYLFEHYEDPEEDIRREKNYFWMV